MKIAVFMKQVPALTEGSMDEKTGVLIRSGMPSITNTYDLHALETALLIKERIGAFVTVYTMGPSSAESVIREAYAMGADNGYLICDRAFAGADVLATSYTLIQALAVTGSCDLILCGKQTTDGDTAQVSGALAKWLELPHINWVTKLLDVNEESITVQYQMNEMIATARAEYPCLLSVETSVCVPRMPSLMLKLQSKKKELKHITVDDLSDQDPQHYGLSGSATKVKRIFPPTRTKRQEAVRLAGNEAAVRISQIIAELGLVKGGS